jgi:hypothetical protein
MHACIHTCLFTSVEIVENRVDRVLPGFTGFHGLSGFKSGKPRSPVSIIFLDKQHLRMCVCIQGYMHKNMYAYMSQSFSKPTYMGVEKQYLCMHVCMYLGSIYRIEQP